MRLRSAVLTCFTAAVTLVSDGATQGAQEFAFGINGHPLMQGAYSYEPGTAAEQFHWLARLGVGWYRVDVAVDSAGTVSSDFIELARAAASHGIKLLPVITQRPGSGITPLTAYARGRRIGIGFGSRYGRWFSHIEAGNELDIWPLASGGGGDGSSLSQYNPDTLAVVTAYLRGLTRGLKTATPKAKVIVNSAGWRHWAFFEALERDTVDYDIVGYHWYSDMGDIHRPVNAGMSVLDHLNKLGKDIWMTEVGRRGTVPDNPVDQALWIAKYTRDFYGLGRVKGFFVYELYEQRDFLHNPEPRDDVEAFYGIIACPADPSGCRGLKRPKPAFEAYRKTLGELLEREG